MYDEDKQDSFEEIDSSLVDFNEKLIQDENDRIKKENETLKKMLETRNAEINKPKENSEETTKREYLQRLSQALGVTQQREEIDRINLSVEHLAGKMQEMIDQTNQLTKLLTQGTTIQPQQMAQDPTQKLQALSELIGPLTEAWKTIKGNNQPQIEPLIDQATINEKMKQTFFDNLETGESINNFIKSSLKKSVTKTIINTALKDIGSSEHGPA